jgi:ankyrin repeat protein
MLVPLRASSLSCNQEALSQMEQFIQNCDSKQAKQWLRIHPNLAILHQPGKPPLIHYAAQQGCHKIFRLLLLRAFEDADTDAHELNLRDWQLDQSDQGSILHSAAAGGNAGILKLLQKHAPGDKQWCTHADASGKLPLHVAAERGHLKLVKLLLREVDSTLNQETADGTTALDLACAHGREDVVGFLLKKKQVRLNPEQLSLAARGGHEKVVKRLLARGGDAMFARDEHGATPLHHAVRNGHMGVVQVLLPCSKVRKAVLDAVKVSDAEGNTPLHDAVKGGYYKPTDKVQVKKGKGLVPGAFSGWVGYLTCAFKQSIGPGYGTADLTQYLVGHGADLMAVNSKGETPRDLLVYGGSRRKWGFARVLEWFGM